MAALQADPRIRVVVTDLEMPGRNGFDLVGAMRASGGRLSGMPCDRPVRTVGAEAVERARSLAISDLVAKFDRSGLVAALSEIEAAGEDGLAKAA